MRAGAMKYRVTLLEPKRITGSMGEETTQYVATKTVHAERVRHSGNRSEEVGEHFANYETEYNIRDAHRVAENWRLQQLGGYLYTVVAIVPNLDRGYVTLKCSRVNE